ELAALLHDGSDLRHLGVAHGDAGIAYALLRWAAATGSAVDPVAFTCLDALLERAEPYAGGLRWPVDAGPGAPEYADGWCHGPAGHAMLFGLAAELAPHATAYADATVACAYAAAATETDLGTLCCGLGGVAYACLCAHRLSGEPIWRTLAERAAIRAARCHG